MMAFILVVEDSADQALMISGLLQNAGYRTEVVGDGSQALETMGRTRPDAVVTDLIMPGVDGLRLVELTKESNPTVPIILVTAYGSGEVALRALRRGAASYVPKRRLVEDLVSTVEDVLSVARERREQVRLLDFLAESRFSFELNNDQDVIAGLVSFLQDHLRAQFQSCSENVLLQVGMAIREALRNAMHHGNLEVGSDLRERSSEEYDSEVHSRLQDPAYSGRKVFLTATFTHSQFRCAVRDQGPGFNPTEIADPIDPENLLRVSGRGLYLVSTFMDRVEHNEIGNEIVMVKRMDSFSENKGEDD
jgi:CheY-like chemotaxis protein